MIDATELGMAGVLYTANSEVPAGRYRRIDAAAREVELAGTGRLPASFDGRIALYVRLTPRPVTA